MIHKTLAIKTLTINLVEQNIVFVEQKTRYQNLTINFVFFKKTIFLIKGWKVDTYARKNFF